MKKLLLAISMLSLVGVAQAQGVSLYGTLDASAYSLNKANGTHNAQGLVDSSVASSIWGIKGTENLGKGLKAVFQVESDISTNNGGTNTSGIFRRLAFVGLQGNHGELALGLKHNPMTSAHGDLLPVQGNSANLNAQLTQGYIDSFTRNAITWTLPTDKNLLVQLQYGMSNSANKTDDGAVYAGRVQYTINNLTLNAATQHRNNNGTASSAAFGNAFKDKETHLVGAKYKLGAVEVGAGYVQNRIDNGSAVGNVNVTLVGLGYTMSPNVKLGANYIKNNNDASLTNLQARYTFSKRTMAYAQYGYAQNGNTSNPFTPVFVNTNSSPADNVSGYGAVAHANQSAIGFGLVHSF